MSHLIPNLKTNPTILSVISGIDLKATGQTTLYTVPAGVEAVITNVFVEITAVNTFATAVTLRAGLASAYTEYCIATALTGLNAVGLYIDLGVTSLLGIHKVFSATDVLKLDITIGAGAATLTGKVTVVGYLR
jgi:hypothetical protein